LDPARDSYLYVPAGYAGATPAPLIVMLHGAGGHGQDGVGLLEALADAEGYLILSPSSCGVTWDMLQEDHGPDVAQIDRGLEAVFGEYNVDAARVVFAGFSDGASYALSLGLGNGDLFTHLLAFSPGFMAPARREGRPRIFIAHGIQDEVLPIARCSRRIVPVLQQAGYPVEYVEFDGGHVVSPLAITAAAAWLEQGAERKGTAAG
jgi:phospholipase/carboxylesterase